MIVRDKDYYLLAEDAVRALKEGDVVWLKECLAAMREEESRAKNQGSAE